MPKIANIATKRNSEVTHGIFFSEGIRSQGLNSQNHVAKLNSY